MTQLQSKSHHLFPPPTLLSIEGTSSTIVVQGIDRLFFQQIRMHLRTKDSWDEPLMLQHPTAFRCNQGESTEEDQFSRLRLFAWNL